VLDPEIQAVPDAMNAASGPPALEETAAFAR
jgi:hypothetical protein